MRRYLLLALVIVVVVVYCARTQGQNFIAQLFPIERVQVRAPFHHVSHTAIAQTVKPFLHTSILQASTAAMEQRLQSLPWVGKATVSRKWPDTLVIHLQERQAIARFNEKGLLDNHGVLFYPSEMGAGELPLLIGDEHTENQLLQHLQKMSKMLANVSLSIAKVQQEATKLTVTLTSGTVLVLSQREANAQLRRFIDIYPSLTKQKHQRLAYVDLRYRYGIAVKWGASSG